MQEMEKYKLYLDDDVINRGPKTAGNWIWVHNFKEFCETIERIGIENFELISFDNDLGDGELEGYDCAKWLVYEKKYDLRNIKINVHSANPKAPDNIYKLINNWNQMVNKSGTDYKPDVEYEK